jgi:hypothetical protein
VLFHDTSERKGDFGIWRLFEELKQDVPTIEFLHAWGLGVAASAQVRRSRSNGFAD